jgi:transposase InsO family protein
MDRVQANSHFDLSQGGRVHLRDYIQVWDTQQHHYIPASNFTSAKFFDFYEQKCIPLKYASVAHPKANGPVERANRMIL